MFGYVRLCADMCAFLGKMFFSEKLRSIVSSSYLTGLDGCDGLSRLRSEASTRRGRPMRADTSRYEQIRADTSGYEWIRPVLSKNMFRPPYGRGHRSAMSLPIQVAPNRAAL